MKILSVVGARPNFMKLAPLAWEFERWPDVEHVIVHTGQHYDPSMSATFFTDLAIPAPRHHCGVGSGSHAAQTAAVMTRLEPVLDAERPDLVVVYGDINSALAGALTAAKRHIPVAHVEAGLRSRDRTMPEEINRLLIDQLSDILLAPSADAVENLHGEGIVAGRIQFVGNIMIDSLLALLPRARQADHPARFAVPEGGYIIATLHRPANVDDPIRLRELIRALAELSRHTPVLLPLHPRTRHCLDAMPGALDGAGTLRILDPLSYPEMLGLVSSAGLVITDSGGLQEETSFLGVPCLTVRPNTERPVTVTQGTNRLVAPDSDAIIDGARLARAARPAVRPTIERWDGRAAERIAAVLCNGAVFS